MFNKLMNLMKLFLDDEKNVYKTKTKTRNKKKTKLIKKNIAVGNFKFLCLFLLSTVLKLEFI